MDRNTLEHLAQACGFAKMGVCNVNAFLQARDLVASQPPLTERKQLRFEPAQEYPWAKSLIVLLWPYHQAPLPEGGSVFIDNYYAASNAAYHAARRLEKMLRREGCMAQANVSFPAKEAAVRAGLGIIGKSSLLITPEYGTRVVIILMATDTLEVTEYSGAGGSGCLNCGRCAHACPVGAIDCEGLSHPEKCLRNFMMEGIIVPEYVRSLMGMKLLGCDACQRVCPMQKLAEEPQKIPIQLDELATEDDSAFSGAVALLAKQIGKNVARPQRVRAQTALLCGNRGNPKDIPLLKRWAKSDSPAVREHAQWALKQISGETSQPGLDQSDEKS